MTEPATIPAGLDPDDLLALYRWMCLNRAAEERLEVLHKQGLVSGSIYRSLGQEAGSVGAAYAMRRRDDGTGDCVTPSIRGAGALLVFGGNLLEYFRHYLSRAAGPSKGRESHIHWGDPQRGIVAPIFPLGTMLEVMAGVTLSFRLRGEDRVGLVFAGDGASSTGAWHEGLCFAAAQQCPMVLVLENNRYAFSTPTDKNTRLESFVDKGAGYGLGTDAVDGTDVLAVREAVAAAAQRARSGQGPQLVELQYFRRAGHAQHDAQEYVDPDVVTEWEAKDPIDLFAARLIADGQATPETLDSIRAACEADCLAASAAAEAEAVPEGAQALQDVYTDVIPSHPWTRMDEARP